VVGLRVGDRGAVFGEAFAGFQHQGTVFSELIATEASNGEAQRAADVCLCDRRENDARHLRARRFVDGFVEECFELSVGFELRSLAVEGGDTLGPGRSQSRRRGA
jgi:hypothetical protein